MRLTAFALALALPALIAADDCGGTTDPAVVADVIAVVPTGSAGAYTFNVTVKSPDTGCDQYADWWEVVSPDGALIYRRILDHSHVDEQPFTRSGGPVPVTASQEVIVRAHLSTTGYGGRALYGTAGGGFAEDPSIDASWFPELADAAPQPDGCAF